MKALEDVKKHSERECGNMACHGLSVKTTGLQEVVNWVKESCTGESLLSNAKESVSSSWHFFGDLIWRTFRLCRFFSLFGWEIRSPNNGGSLFAFTHTSTSMLGGLPLHELITRVVGEIEYSIVGIGILGVGDSKPEEARMRDHSYHFLRPGLEPLATVATTLCDSGL